MTFGCIAYADQYQLSFVAWFLLFVCAGTLLAFLYGLCTCSCTVLQFAVSAISAALPALSIVEPTHPLPGCALDLAWVSAALMQV